MPTNPERVLIASLRGLVTRLENLEAQVASCSATSPAHLLVCVKELAVARQGVVNVVQLLNRQRYP